MLLRRIMNVYQTGNTPIFMGKLTGYVSTLNTRRDILEKRFAALTGYESQGVVILRHILGQADIPALLTYDSDISRYAYGVAPILNDLERIIDPVTTGIVRKDLFIRNTSHTTLEVLVPVTRADPLRSLPMDAGWDAWATVRTVRLLSMDSAELTFHAYQDQIHLRHDMPSVVVIAIDIAALCLQYAAYRRTHPEAEDSVQAYLHQYVLMNGFLEDLQNLWLRDRYLRMVQGDLTPEMSKPELHQHIRNNVYGYIGSQYPAAMEEVYALVQRIQNGVTPAGHLLASLPMAQGTVTQYVTAAQRDLELEDLRQNLWVMLLRDLPWIQLAYQAYQLNPRFTQFVSLQRQVIRDLKLVMNMRPWSNVHNTKVRQHVESQFYTLFRLVDAA
jgi:hypothetical protein